MCSSKLPTLFGDRLQDVVYTEGKSLYLVFEYLDLDLMKYIETRPEFSTDPRLVKVSVCPISLHWR